MPVSDKKMRQKLFAVFFYSLGVLLILYVALLLSEFYQIFTNSNLTIFEIPGFLFNEYNFLKNPITIYQNETLSTLHLAIGHAFFGMLGSLWFYYEVDKRGEYHKKEKGSAEFATETDIRKYGLNQKRNNIILSQTEFLPVDPHEIHRNLNIAVLGGTGTQKTRGFVKPNLMQCNTSFVVTDPKGELYRECGNMLKKADYDVKLLNLSNPDFTDGYNPFDYIEHERDINILTKTIKENTLSKDYKSNDFFDKAASALLRSLLHYVNQCYDDKDKHLMSVFDLVLKGKQKEEGENTELDKLFEDLKRKDGEHPAVKAYEVFQIAPMKTRNSILITLGTQLSFLNSPELKNVVLEDTMDLRNHSKKRAIFVGIPDSHSTYNVLISLFFSQMFQILYEEAEKNGGQLDIHHQFILDEFANIGQIPDFVKKISTMRSRKISAVPIFQDEAQVKNLYKDNAPTILSNCDTILYMGGSNRKAAEEQSKRLGETTIEVKEYSKQKTAGGRNSVTKTKRKAKRELMTADEILRLDDDIMLLTIRGFKPFKSKKYIPSLHEKYKQISDENNFLNYKTEYDKEGHINNYERFKHESEKRIDNIEQLEKELSEEKTEDEEQNIQNFPGEDSDKEEKDEENILKESS